MRHPLVRLLLICVVAAVFLLPGSNSHLLAGEGLPGSQPASPLLPKPTATPVRALTAATPPPPILLADCVPDANSVRCHDRLLALDFAYPTFMGDLVDTQLRAGGIEGVAYEYMFTGGSFGAQAGGRSHVFAEARGGMVTDQKGFGDRNGAQVCAEFGYASCQEIKPGVLLAVLALEAEHICSMGSSVGVMDAHVIVNLPHHLAVNGFGFMAQLLSSEESDSLLDAISDPVAGWQCDDAAQAAYNRERLALVRKLEAGTAALEIQARYDATRCLAQSIKGPYVSGDVYAPLRPLRGWQCNTTLPNGSTPPGERPDAYFYGNGGMLWTRLWPGGIVLITEDSQVRADGAYLVDFPWWRVARGKLTVASDLPNSRFEAIIPAGYGDEGLQPSTLIFPGAGCWQITARVTDQEQTVEQLTIALQVKDVRQ